MPPGLVAPVLLFDQIRFLTSRCGAPDPLGPLFEPLFEAKARATAVRGIVCRPGS
jgi:hypothetical protein